MDLSMPTWVRARPYLCAGILFGPVAIGIGYLAEGLGICTNMTAARVVVPFACLAAGKYSSAAIVVCLLAIVEWPIYGYFVDWTSRKVRAIGAVLAVHTALAAWLFIGPWERWQFQ